jgi:hypothetical protein
MKTHLKEAIKQLELLETQQEAKTNLLLDKHGVGDSINFDSSEGKAAMAAASEAGRAWRSTISDYLETLDDAHINTLWALRGMGTSMFDDTPDVTYVIDEHTILPIEQWRGRPRGCTRKDIIIALSQTKTATHIKRAVGLLGEDKLDTILAQISAEM